MFLFTSEYLYGLTLEHNVEFLHTDKDIFETLLGYMLDETKIILHGYLALSGYNSYTEFFLGHYGEQFEELILLDKSKVLSTAYGPVMSADKVTSEQWIRVQLVILMTDNHAASIQRDLSSYIASDKMLGL